MRLVALAAVLRSQCGLDKGPQGAKGVVFLSSCAGVDFHHALLGRVYEGIMEEPLLPCPLFRLHGSLEQVTQIHQLMRLASRSGLCLFAHGLRRDDKESCVKKLEMLSELPLACWSFGR